MLSETRPCTSSTICRCSSVSSDLDARDVRPNERDIDGSRCDSSPISCATRPCLPLAASLDLIVLERELTESASSSSSLASHSCCCCTGVSSPSTVSAPHASSAALYRDARGEAARDVRGDALAEPATLSASGKSSTKGVPG